MQLRPRRWTNRARVAAALDSEEGDEDHGAAVDEYTDDPAPAAPVYRPRPPRRKQPAPPLLKSAFKFAPQAFDLDCLCALRLVSKACRALAETSPIALKTFKFWRHPSAGHAELLALLRGSMLARRATALHVYGRMEFGLGASVAKHAHLQRLERVVLDAVGPGAEAIISGAFPLLSSFTIRNVHPHCRILAMLQRAPWRGLRELTVCVGGAAAAVDVAAALAAFPQLRTLTLSFVNIQGLVERHFLKDSLQNLVALTLEDDPSAAVSAAAQLGFLGPGGPPLPCLRELDLNLAYSAFPDLVDMASAPWVPALRTLRLRGHVGWGGGAVAHLLARLADGPLKRLVLWSRDSMVWDFDWEGLRLPHLTALALGPSSDIFPDVLSRLAAASLPHLEALDLGAPFSAQVAQGVRLADAEGVDAAAAVLPRLRRLRITGVGLTEPVLARLGAAMAPRLEECVVHENGAPGAGLVCLSAASRPAAAEAP